MILKMGRNYLKISHSYWSCLVSLLVFIYLDSLVVNCVEIRRLSVPRFIQNGTEDSVILDCEYVWNENDFRLVVKWFFKDNLEPVYQWIPELHSRHISGVLKNRIDMDFTVNTVDPYSRFRALRILRPSIDLSGKYTCLVTSLAAQDSRDQVMTVFVPANEFELSYVELSYDLVNVTCDAQGAFPLPVLKLLVRSPSGSAPQTVQDAKRLISQKQSGAFDVHLQRTFSASELPKKKDTSTVFECLLELPGTNYVKSKRIAYFPGIQGPSIDVPHSLASLSKLVQPSIQHHLLLLFIFFSSKFSSWILL